MRQLGDPLNVELTDHELAAEVNLLAMLIVVANGSEGQLGQAEIDSVLLLN